MVRPLVETVSGIVHEPTQVTERGIDLTVSELHAVAEPGRVDFGGDELESAELTAVETARRNPDDDYGWWTLDAGQYLLEYNEQLDADGGHPLVLQTRDEVRARGAFHPTLFVTSLEAVPFSVGGGGIELKENARVSTLVEIGQDDRK